LDGIPDQEALDEATKILLLLVQSIGIEPCRALLHQVGRQQDLFGGNQFEQ